MPGEADAMLQRWQQIEPERRKRFVAAMTPDITGVLLEILPPEYDDLIIQVTKASPDMVQDEMGPAMPGPAMPQPGRPGFQPPAAPMESFASALGSPTR